MRVTHARPVIIIGLDSARLDLIAPWAAAGDLPNCGHVLPAPAGRLRSTIQPDQAGLGPRSLEPFYLVTTEPAWQARGCRQRAHDVPAGDRQVEARLRGLGYPG